MDDAVVVGAGPAGLSAALALVDAGAAVTVVEQLPSPPPRVCGAFINPEGTAHLATLGVLDEVVQAGAVPVHEARLTLPGGREEVTRIAGQGRTGLALSRQTLEQVLVAVLTARGGSLRWRTRATAARADGGVWRVTCRSGGDEWEAPASLVVIADGRFSSLSGRGRRRTARGWFGWNTTFEGVDAAPGSLTLHFCQAGYVGTLTFADGLTNVCGLTWLDARVVSWEDVLAGAMAERRPLGRLLAPAARQAPFRAVGPLPFSGGMWRGNGPLLAGDAAAVTDPFLGEGISRALGTGPLLSAALAATNRADGRGTLGTLGTHYNRLWRSRYHPRLRLGFAARWLVAHPALLGQVLGRVGTRSRAFQRVLALAHGRGR